MKKLVTWNTYPSVNSTDVDRSFVLALLLAMVSAEKIISIDIDNEVTTFIPSMYLFVGQFLFKFKFEKNYCFRFDDYTVQGRSQQ